MFRPLLSASALTAAGIAAFCVWQSGQSAQETGTPPAAPMRVKARTHTLPAASVAESVPTAAQDAKAAGEPALPEAEFKGRRLPQYAAAPAASASDGTAGPADDLLRRAARVEQSANKELKRLVRLLDLTPAQQDRVFERLAINSPAWQPGMTIAGIAGEAPVEDSGRPSAGAPAGRTETPVAVADTVTKAPEADASADRNSLNLVSDLLTAEQLLELTEAEVARNEWWTEVLEQIEEDIVKAADGDMVKEDAGPGVLE